MKNFIYLTAAVVLFCASCQPQSSNNNNAGESPSPSDEEDLGFQMGEPPENDTMKHEQTEFYEPVPPEVTPGEKNTAPPSDAIVLFDGKDLDGWVKTDDTSQQAEWIVDNGIFTVKPGTGNIQTRQKFRDYQLHLEFREPKEPDKEGQNHGNSGLFLASLGKGDDGYELQILNS